MMEKFDRCESKIKFRLNSNSSSFDDLESREMKISKFIKIVGLRSVKGTIEGRVIAFDHPEVASRFLEDLKMVLNLIGISVDKDEWELFPKKENRISNILANYAININVNNQQRSINLRKVITQELAKRIVDEREKCELVCFMLNINELLLRADEALLLYLPISLKQLVDIIFEVDETLDLKTELDKDEKREAEKLMESANKLFESETGFRIGDMLNRGFDENRYFRNSSGDKKAYRIIKKLNLRDDEEKSFILIRALRNAVAHFNELEDSSENTEKNFKNISLELKKFRRFLSKYGETYNNISRRIAFRWLGIEEDFEKESL